MVPQVGGGVDQTVNEGNPDDDELDTIREDMSAPSDSGRSETEVDEVWTGDLSPRTLHRKTLIEQENQENYRPLHHPSPFVPSPR